MIKWPTPGILDPVLEKKWANKENNEFSMSTHRITLSELRPMNEFLSIVRILILSWISLKNKIQSKRHLFVLLWAFQYNMLLQTQYFFLIFNLRKYYRQRVITKVSKTFFSCRAQTFLIKKAGAKHFQHPHTFIPNRLKTLKCIKAQVYNPEVDEIAPPANILPRKCNWMGCKATPFPSLPTRRRKAISLFGLIQQGTCQPMNHSPADVNRVAYKLCMCLRT